MAEKKRFLASHSKSSALVISLVLHGVLIAAALVFVAFRIINPEPHDGFGEVSVKPPPSVDTAPRVRKPQPENTSPASMPDLTIRSDANPDFARIDVPAIAIQPGQVTDTTGSLPDLNVPSLSIPDFGEDEPQGNELAGTFYDLKQTRKGEPVEMNINRFFAALAHFANGWNLGRLDDYFQAPKKKYTSMFMIPTIDSSKAAEAFDVADIVKPDYWAAYYVGQIAAPATGYYRFHGYGDDVLLVRINNRLVLDAGFADYRPKLQTGWESDDENNRRFPLGKQLLYIGDWFKLNKGDAVKMEVLIGDVGGLCSSQLLIEQRDAEYRQVSFQDSTRPVLPAFTTREIPKAVRNQIVINPDEVSLDGPAFSVITK